MRIIIILIIILTACSQNSDKNKKDLEVIENTSDQVQKELGGNWLNKKYADKLLETKSPKASQDVVALTMLMLPGETYQPAKLIWGFHERTDGILKQKNGVLGIQMENGEDFTQTFKFENNILKTENDEFIKVKDSKSDNYDIAEQLLFAGKYDINGKEVEFTSDGRIMGLDSISYYSVLIDYLDAGMDVDQLRLGTNVDKSILYRFEFKQNRLLIYHLDCIERMDDHCDVVANGQKLFEMIKK